MQDVDLERLYRKIERRLLPTLFAAYVLNHLDRVNLGFGQLQMRGDLGLSDATYSLAAGMYFIGYLLFEVPANALIQKLGGRKVLAAMVAAWGLAAAATMLVQTPTQLLVARAVLGVLEAGFFPGVIYYLSRWLPANRRGRVMSTFMMAVVVAGLISGPLSGWMMETFHTLYGLAGWQWMFLLQGLPGVPLALLILWRLPDGPASATWLTSEERSALSAGAHDGSRTGDRWLPSAIAAVKNVRLHIFMLAGFLVKCGSFALVFWVPALIKATGVEDLRTVGLLSALPNLLVLAAMALVGRSSDRLQERRWHFAGAALVGAAALLALGSIPRSLPLVLLVLSIASAGLASCMPVLWAALSASVSARGAAIAIALAGSVSNLSGLVGPVVLGYAKQSGNESLGFTLLAVLVACGAAMVLWLVKEAACWSPDGVKSTPRGAGIR